MAALETRIEALEQHKVQQDGVIKALTRQVERQHQAMEQSIDAKLVALEDMLDSRLTEIQHALSAKGGHRDGPPPYAPTRPRSSVHTAPMTDSYRPSRMYR